MRCPEVSKVEPVFQIYAVPVTVCGRTAWGATSLGCLELGFSRPRRSRLSFHAHEGASYALETLKLGAPGRALPSPW